MESIPTDCVLSTERCRLRQPSEADIEHVWSATRVPGFNEGMRWEPPGKIAELSEPLRWNREDWELGTSYSFTVEARDGSCFIGRAQIRREEPADEWTLGFWTHPREQGQGYALEAARAVVEFGFARRGARLIGAAHATWNDASRRVLLNLGMHAVRTNPQGFKKRGLWVEELEYELVRPAQG
jgi:RimJ/RimL family protein N-acetyltransferase